MSEPLAPVDLILLWHHHQPDYRSPRDGRAVLPWVRLHASKDYLDMALRLERHPRVRATFNFVPSLLDQLEDVVAGGADELFDRLARPLAGLGPEDRASLAGRCVQAPPHAFERWPAYRTLRERLTRGPRESAAPVDPASPAAAGERGGALADQELLALEIWFLLAWVDPMFHGAPEVAGALAERARWSERHRDDLLALHRRLAAEVIPAYRALAARGQIELSCSPYHHPILPLLFDLAAARRARPDLALPAETLRAPEDARWHIERALERHQAAFGARPAGMWPSEGSVSPEVVALAAAGGVRWLASDEGVLWASLPEAGRHRAALYQPWSFAAGGNPVALFFRDRELSDRIGFVYRRWDAQAAAADFIARLRRIGRDHAGANPPVVPVILDGENCWEHYADDGGPFLTALYEALDAAPDIRTRTPADVLAEARTLPHLERLASGSWIDADFHIWIGHPEKNRAWDLLARTRRALVDSGATPASAPRAWSALYRAEASDWFWWFGEDHHTDDRPVFDRLFRESLRCAHEGAGLEPPATLMLPIVRAAGAGPRRRPVAFVRPVLDGQRTNFYEWHGAGWFVLGAGSAMHRGGGLASELHYGFDPECLYLRLDFTGEAPGPDVDLTVQVVEPRPARLRVAGLVAGERHVLWTEGSEATAGAPVPGARCCIGRVLELGVPFASLGLVPGEAVVLQVELRRGGGPLASFPDEGGLTFAVPTADFEAMMWSA